MAAAESEQNGQTIVIKIGTSSLLKTDSGVISLSTLANLVETICELRSLGHNVILVSSGAVGAGCQRLGVKKRPTEIAQLQALAAIGQIHLMRLYDDFFHEQGYVCAQVLLTYDNLGERSQYTNARNTFLELMRQGVVPVVNENDTVAVQELRFGDNDRLAALVGGLVNADWVFILTDVDGLYTANPKRDPSARLIPEVADIDALQVDSSTAGTDWGTGGMASKLSAARLAVAAGVRAVILHGRDPHAIVTAVTTTPSPAASANAPASSASSASSSSPPSPPPCVGTHFLPHPRPVRTGKRWIIGLHPKGSVTVDAGAARAVSHRNSLFAAGIHAVQGDFNQSDTVRILSVDGHEIARGLVNYSSEEVEKIRKLRSADVAAVLGYTGPGAVVDRGNIVLLSLHSQSQSTNPTADDKGDGGAAPAAEAETKQEVSE